MRELIRSMLSFSWGISLFGVKQLENFMAALDPNQPRNKAISAFDAVTHATEEHLDGAIKEAFRAGDRAQRNLLDMIFGSVPTEQAPAPRDLPASGTLRTPPPP